MATNINPRTRPLLPSDSEIITACAQNPPCDENLKRLKGLKYPQQSPVCWIKYGRKSDGRDAEARTHDFAFRALEQIDQQQRQGRRIPEVYRIFTDEHPSGDFMVYIVMEFVPDKTLEQVYREGVEEDVEERMYQQIARAIRLFLTFKVPDNATPGPHGGGIIKHPLFKYYEAAIEYPTTAKLQQHINKGNFMFTDDGTLYIIDFEQAACLPVTFLAYALRVPQPACPSIKKYLDLPQRNVPGMVKAGSYFIMSVQDIGQLAYEASRMGFVEYQILTVNGLRAPIGIKSTVKQMSKRICQIFTLKSHSTSEGKSCTAILQIIGGSLWQ